MLQSGQKLRVSVKFQGKSHSYVGTIINTTEDVFWVKQRYGERITTQYKKKIIDLLKIVVGEGTDPIEHDRAWVWPNSPA